MAVSILAAVQRIKAEIADWLAPEAIRELCQTLGYSWRERLLDPVTTLHLFVLQVMHGNTACAHVPHLGDVRCTGEAYGQARGRLPLALFRCLLLLLKDRWPTTAPEAERWHGHRTFLVDGSSASMPDAPALQEAYGQPSGQKPGCGFPMMHLLALFHAASGFLIQVAAAPWRTHDMSRVGAVHADLAAGDVLVGDRAFCSFAHRTLLAARQVLGVFRVHQKQSVDLRPHRRAATGRGRKRGEKGLPSSRWLKRLGRHDQLVEYPKPKQRPEWLTAEDYAALPEAVLVRELRYTIRIPGRRTRVVTLATTLLDPVKYPAADVAELYGQQWQIETNFRHLKQTLGMDVLRRRRWKAWKRS